MAYFYRRAVLTLLIMLAFSVAVGFLGLKLSRIEVPLLPIKEAGITWVPSVYPEQPNEGTETHFVPEGELIDFNFTLSSSKQFPYASYNINFYSAQEPQQTLSLSRYSGVKFEVTCTPSNVLLFVLHSHDQKITNPEIDETRRVSSRLFSCNPEPNTIDIPLDELWTPDWWLGRFDGQYDDRKYRKDKVYGFALVNSLDSPRATKTHVKVNSLHLTGSNTQLMVIAFTFIAVVWILLIVWLVRLYIRVLIAQVKDKVRQDRPLIAYKELTIAPQKDKEKSAVLRYMATEYANPDLSLEVIIEALGINRAKINNILRDELGLTFSSYLNKLRLTESARLLSEKEDANVAEIAYSVGYNNVSYFNRLFKAEYGCTPKTFKSMYQSGEVTDEGNDAAE